MIKKQFGVIKMYKAGIVCAQNKQNKGSQVRRTKKESY